MLQKKKKSNKLNLEIPNNIWWVKRDLVRASWIWLVRWSLSFRLLPVILGVITLAQLPEEHRWGLYSCKNGCRVSTSVSLSLLFLHSSFSNWTDRLVRVKPAFGFKLFIILFLTLKQPGPNIVWKTVLGPSFHIAYLYFEGLQVLLISLPFP